MVHSVQKYAVSNEQIIIIGRETFMKNAKKLLALGCVGCLAYVLATSEALQEKLFNGKYEDQYLKIVELARLAGDVCMWPVHYVKAILP